MAPQMFSPGVSFLISDCLPVVAWPIGIMLVFRRSLLSLSNPQIIKTFPIAVQLLDNPLCRAFLDITQSKIHAVAASLGVYVTYRFLRGLRASYKLKQEAVAMGATYPPRLDGKLPWNLDMVWNVMRLSEVEDYPGQMFIDLSKKLGTTFSMSILGKNLTWTANPSHIKAVLATDFTSFEKGSLFRSNMKSVLGNGVFNSDGDMWKFHRAMTRPFFSRDRVTDFEMFKHHSDIAILKMKERSSQGFALDYQDVLSRFTMDTASEFLFGKCVHSLDTPLALPGSAGSLDVFSRAFSESQRKIVLRTKTGNMWPLMELFGDRTKEDVRNIHAFLDPILEGALKKKVENLHKDSTVMDGAPTEDGYQVSTLLDDLVSATQDRTIIRDELLNILIAGRDTTASALTFAIYFLTQHKECFTRLREEILQSVGADASPTYEQLKDLKYLRAVINETLRLVPPVPFDVRQSVKTTVWEDPATGVRTFIPENTQIMYSLICLHRNPDFWGPDAIEFCPERWIDGRARDAIVANPFIYIPFNAGPRICLGQQFALNEMSFFLVRLLQSFDDITLAPDAQPPWSHPPAHWKQGSGRMPIEKILPQTHLTSYIYGGLWVNMHSSN